MRRLLRFFVAASCTFVALAGTPVLAQFPSRAVVAAMTSLGKALNLTIVAEGVETEEQLEELLAPEMV